MKRTSLINKEIERGLFLSLRKHLVCSWTGTDKLQKWSLTLTMWSPSSVSWSHDPFLSLYSRVINYIHVQYICSSIINIIIYLYINYILYKIIQIIYILYIWPKKGKMPLIIICTPWLLLLRSQVVNFLNLMICHENHSMKSYTP